MLQVRWFGAPLPRGSFFELDRARSRLHRSEILQLNMCLKALAEIYTMHSFAQLLESIIENWEKKDLAKTTPKR